MICFLAGRRLGREGSVLGEDGKHTLQKEEFAVVKSSSGDEERERESKKGSSGKRKRKLSRERKETHHWLPRIHEDYYGPRMHRPKHH